MLTDVYVSYRNTNAQICLDIPNICPHCGKVMKPHIYQGYSEYQSHEQGNEVGILAQCTILECKNFFALKYTHTMGKNFYLKNYTYNPPVEFSLPENIIKVSEKFVEIYSQSTQAESSGLNQIAGVGYRKSTEFLIKDYAIRNNPDDKEKIEKMFLGKVVDHYLNDFEKLQNLAKASTWIGNDETHYVRRHEDKDIKDMKNFILSAAHFIAADYDADVALEFISEQ